MVLQTLVLGMLAIGIAEGPTPYINTWLVIGPFENGSENAGMARDWVSEASAAPAEGVEAAGQTWRYFNDRLFSRNYDDYQDLFSYFWVKRGESVAAKVAYAHAYVYSPSPQGARLLIGADNQFKAWINGALVGESTQPLPQRDAMAIPVSLTEGWNRLLLKIGNQENGRLGFYARLADAHGLVFAVDPPDAALVVATRGMAGVATAPLPIAYREWPYFGVSAASPGLPADQAAWLRKPEIAMHASAFMLTAAGGAAPYQWRLAEGALPQGMSIPPDGVLGGTPAKDAALGDYSFIVEVADAAGAVARETFTLTLRERPNKWYEETRLTALLHHPEAMPDDGYDDFAQLMKRQGYGVGMVISYNNGDHAYRWPSVFQPDNPADLVGRYKSALERAGITFGMYIGNLNGPNHNGDNGALLLVEDAMRRYNPKAFWFDWAGWDGTSLDAIYSMIRAYDPDAVIVLNGIPTMSNGDWDVVVLEGWGAWGDRLWDLWPAQVWWPKRPVVESWRLVADPAFEYSRDIQPDWQDYLRMQISLICEGFVANIDHSVTIASGIGPNGKLPSLDASPLMQAHRQMAAWANPEGLPPLYESYLGVWPAPFAEAPWGYSVLGNGRDIVYLHVLSTFRGKQGMPADKTLMVEPIKQMVTAVTCMNTGASVPFAQDGERVVVDASAIAPDAVDTIFKLTLAGPHPDVPRPPVPEAEAVPPGNLAFRKPAKLLSNRDDSMLPGSAFHFAHYGVDGLPFTFACAGNEWAWTYHLDLQESRALDRAVIHFGEGYATDFEVLRSADGAEWASVTRMKGEKDGVYTVDLAGAAARYLRVRAHTPNGPDQEGLQMFIHELEVYARD